LNAAPAPEIASSGTPDADPPTTAAAALGDLAGVDPAAKLARGLRERAIEVASHAKEATARREPVIVRSLARLDLGQFSDYAHQFTWPGGEHVAVLDAAPADLLRIAALPGVYAVDWASPEAPSEAPRPPGFERPELTAPEISALRARLRSAPAWGEAPAPDARGAGVGDKAHSPDPGAADGWFDVRSGHAAREAWELGYEGDGVRVAVLDDAVDFAHPDLQGTWATLPPGHPYVGWPQVFDPMVGYLRVQDRNPARRPEQWSTRIGTNGMIDMYQSSRLTERDVSGRRVLTACFRPFQYVGTVTGPITPTLGAEDCSFVVPRTSRGGEVRYGHHPDPVLRSIGAKPAQNIQAELASILLVDEHAPGVFDTVYVDMDADRDFTDEKPMSRADPLGWRDADGDGLADLSGGLLYFVADGKLPFPGSWVWGLEGEVPEAGRVIGIHYQFYIAGGHGTLCASNVVSQGRVGVPPDFVLKFRDLPGDQEPPGVNRGMAPAAELVSVGDVYAVGRAMFAPAWRYIMFGHDVERMDDKIQVASNSYGWSNEDNDGWDADSRLIDYYIRTFAPEMTFLHSTGNGGPGYGTIAPPSPATGLEVAASTQFGSTGVDSITDTTQITYGDIIPFSNRGPGAAGGLGPDLAADGAHAAGAIPLGFAGNARFANATWGGTSRSTPVLAGATALAYEAFRGRHGRWPTWQEAKALMQGGARFAGYDTLTMGAGVLDAGDSVRTAAGRHGVYALPSEWTAGHYRGAKHGAFAKLLAPGERDTQSITLHNPSDHPIQVTISAQTPRRIGSHEDAFTTDRAMESSSPSPDYLRPIDRRRVPEGTDLMVVRTRYPYAQFDLDANLSPDNFFYMGVIQHTDINGDGKLWVDRSGNGVVNSRLYSPTHLELRWDDQMRDHDAVQGSPVFTTQLDEDGVTAEIAWYGLGCSDPDGNPPLPAQEVQEKIALIERGGCTFFQKLSNAKNAGAIGAVVFTDARPVAVMGSTEGTVDLPGLMIERDQGLALQQLLIEGAVVTAGMLRRTSTPPLKGIDGIPPIVYPDSDIQPFEYMRMTEDAGVKNNFALSVHHPLQRWADGLYLAAWHPAAGRSTAITNTQVSVRMDFYAYRQWDAVSLSTTSLTVPPGGEATFDATLGVPAGGDVLAKAAYGALHGAIFVDYDRGIGDAPVPAPGGYEPQRKRLVIPVNTTVAARYEWQGSVALGGAGADDRDAPYNNGAMWGAFKWNWRPESGDWRFFFVDGATKPAGGTFWLFRTLWEDPAEKQADIDTRVYGPEPDRSAKPVIPPDTRIDPSWYGPYALTLLARSPYRVVGSTWPFDTSSGANEDWLVVPAGEGLHEVMLHNVLFSGTQFEMPFETTASSIRIGTRIGTDRTVPASDAQAVTIVGQQCSTIEITSQMDLPGFRIRGFGMAVPEITRNNQVVQDNPANRASSSFKRDLTLTGEAGRFRVRISGHPEDDLDLIVLRDANTDGNFDYPTEMLGQSLLEFSLEEVTLPGIAAAGNYQIWVHGFQLRDPSQAATFDLTIDVVTGDTILLKDTPRHLRAGDTATVEVCVDPRFAQREAGPAFGLVAFGPGAGPAMFQLPVTWWRKLPGIYLPLAAREDRVGDRGW